MVDNNFCNSGEAVPMVEGVKCGRLPDVAGVGETPGVYDAARFRSDVGATASRDDDEEEFSDALDVVLGTAAQFVDFIFSVGRSVELNDADRRFTYDVGDDAEFGADAVDVNELGEATVSANRSPLCPCVPVSPFRFMADGGALLLFAFVAKGEDGVEVDDLPRDDDGDCIGNGGVLERAFSSILASCKGLFLADDTRLEIGGGSCNGGFSGDEDDEDDDKGAFCPSNSIMVLLLIELYSSSSSASE